MTSEEFRDASLGLIDPSTAKLWLTRVNGHRLDFICSAGSEQLQPVETLERDGEFILLGQQVPDDVRQDLQRLFEHFVSQQSPSEVIPLF